MKVNLSTVASKCGVSITTVSRVLGGKAAKYRISPKTAERVRAEARRSCYVSNKFAQKLRNEDTKTIGLLIPSLDNLYFAQMSSVIISEIRRHGYSTLVMDTMEDEKTFEESLAQLLDRNVDGIIATPCGTDSSMVENVYSKGVPLVLIDRSFEGSQIPYVATNNYKGGMDATNALILHGHKNILCIQGSESSPNTERVNGYMDAMKQAGLEEYIQVSGNEFTVQNGYLEAKLMLLKEKRPTAIFSLSNNITLGVIKALRESGIKIPDDVSLVSFDSFQHMEFVDPPITRIAQPVGDMAMLATKILFRSIVHEVNTVSQLKVASTFVSGNSIAKCKD